MAAAIPGPPKLFSEVQFEMPFCSQCGADVTGVSFCPKCGAPASGEPAGGAQPAGSSPASGEGPAPSGGPPPGQTAPSIGADISENVAAALSYITPVAIVLLLIEPYKNRRFVRFHSFQSIFYAVATIVIAIGLAVLGGILSLAGIGIFVTLVYPLFQLGVFVVWIILIIKAYQNQMFKLPIIGDYAEKQ